jgi:hypothetical protein
MAVMPKHIRAYQFLGGPQISKEMPDGMEYSKPFQTADRPVRVPGLDDLNILMSRNYCG